MSFIPVSPELLFSRQDPNDPRLGETVVAVRDANSLSAPESSNDRRPVAVFGYPDDEGIRLSGGRTGAAEAPDRIRKYLYKMTPPLLRAPKRDVEKIFDCGNLNPQKQDLSRRHEIAKVQIEKALRSGFRTLSLGGGHDYGYADAAGFVRYCQDLGQKPLVINFDAHLDVRPLDRGLSSGTPFFRLLSEFQGLDFVEIGLQNQCNSRRHLEWLQDHGGISLTYEEWLSSGESWTVFVSQRLGDLLLRRRPTFLSIDIDAFSNAYAMGCSQSFATGFTPEEFLPLYRLLLARLQVDSLAIYEVSPPLDLDDRTSKLAALLAYQFL